jgi:hypothetical protein
VNYKNQNCPEALNKSAHEGLVKRTPECFPTVPHSLIAQRWWYNCPADWGGGCPQGSQVKGLKQHFVRFYLIKILSLIVL